MPSFDIVNQVDLQEVDNAVNNTRKMTQTRYDFRGSKTEIELNRKDSKISILTEDNMKMKAIESELISNLVKRQVDAKSVRFGEPERAAGDLVKLDAEIIAGIDKETARKIVKIIKETKMKIQAAIQEDQVRVTAKKIDDLQSVIALMKEQDLGVPLQYVNMRS
ncbi:MAG: YajQ family cyclic di-GMP-binding protein [Thermoleophilia bacterium]|nr:YajQ family cyclic di-GMP-binding protein [Thermoleophilia bacterium]